MFWTKSLCFLSKIRKQIRNFAYVFKVEYSIYYSPFSIVVGCSVGAAVAAAEVVVVGDPEVLGANSLATYGKTV
jgi:hypothetical protein